MFTRIYSQNSDLGAQRQDCSVGERTDPAWSNSVAGTGGVFNKWLQHATVAGDDSGSVPWGDGGDGGAGTAAQLRRLRRRLRSEPDRLAGFAARHRLLYVHGYRQPGRSASLPTTTTAAAAAAATAAAAKHSYRCKQCKFTNKLYIYIQDASIKILSERRKFL